MTEMLTEMGVQDDEKGRGMPMQAPMEWLDAGGGGVFSSGETRGDFYHVLFLVVL